MEPPPQKLRPRALARVLRRRCPQCGDGRLFARYARLHAACSRCGLIYRREAGSQTGSMYLTAIVTEVFAALLLWAAWIWTDWETATFLWVAVPAVLVFSIFVLPVAQALWVGVEYVTDAHNGERWVDPRP